MSFINEPEIWRGILESVPTGLCVLDSQKRIVLWSDGAERITGRLRHEVVGRSCVSEPILHCNQTDWEYCSEECPFAQSMKTAHRVEAKGVLHHKTGYEIPVRTRAVPVYNEHGSIIGAVETFEENKEASNPERQEHLSQSESDPVTAAAGRRTTESHLAKAFAKFRECQIRFGILLLRIEQLSKFKARFGAEAASSFLRLVARTLEGTLWKAEVIGRWSEDQFLMLLPACEEEVLQSTRERVRRTVAGESVEWWGERHSLPVSIGEATIQHGDTLEMLLDRAQASLNASSAWLSGRSLDRGPQDLDIRGSK